MSRRIRTVKPEWLEDEVLASASDEARVLSIGLILLADDYGNGRASIATIAAEVWRFALERNDGADAPEVIAKASRAFRELVAKKFIGVWVVSGQTYYTIRNWLKHQRVDKPGKPLVPAPPKGLFDGETSEENGASGKSREPVARVFPPPRAVVAPDLDLDQDLEGNGATTREDARSPAPVAAVSEPIENRSQATPCPPDLPERLEALGVHIELAQHLKCDPLSVSAELRSFRDTWVVGKLAGQSRSHWAGKARQWVIGQHRQGRLIPPGELAHIQQSEVLTPERANLVKRLADKHRPRPLATVTDVTPEVTAAQGGS